MKLIGPLALLSLLLACGCCWNADSCTEVWGDGGVDAPVEVGPSVDGSGDGQGSDGLGDGGGDAREDAMADAMPPECFISSDCSKDEKPYCDLVGRAVCRECRTNSECSAGRVCGVGKVAGRCRECNVNTDCPTNKPICGDDNACHPCVEDGQCNSEPKLCLESLGGRCATLDDVAYVELKAECESNNGTKGTRDNPFCSPAKAIEEAQKTKTRNVLLLVGSRDVAGASVSIPPADDIVIISKGPGVTVNTNVPALELLSGKLHVRGLPVKNNVGVGVRASGANSFLSMDRCLVQGNLSGGIEITDKAAFRISNTIVADNGTVGRLVGGIVVKDASIATNRRVLQHVTIVNNKGQLSGLTCESEITATGVLAFSNGQASLQCGVTNAAKNCCDNPVFGAEFRLGKTSPMSCINQITETNGTFDVFGQLRTNAGDCGADELDGN